VTRRLAAVTGATGFLGRHLVRTLADDGWDVRILARRDPIHPLWRGLQPQLALGDLGDADALARLCAGADAVFHCAGLIKARNRGEFEAVNVEGARRLARAVRVAAPLARMVAVSSLAAREPQLSDYAASKRAGEAAALDALDGRATIARPAAVYGPGDLETLRLFQAAATSPVLPLLDPRARTAVVHGADAARQIVALAQGEPAGRTFTVCDGRPEGYDWRELMHTAAAACGSRPRLLRAPGRALAPAATLTDWTAKLFGTATMLTPGKLRELTHLDWSVPPHEIDPARPPPAYDLRSGFEHTVSWYRSVGWLQQRQQNATHM